MEIRGAGVALLDEPLSLGVRAAPAGTPLRWRARVRDDDGRVWRAEAASPAELDLAWAPAKAGTGPVAALLSLRPVEVEVRAEAPDGRAAARTITRRLVADGVRLRRWRDGLAATLHLPPPAVDAVATVIADTREEAAPDGAGARGEAGPEGADLRGAGGGVASAAPARVARRRGAGGRGAGRSGAGGSGRRRARTARGGAGDDGRARGADVAAAARCPRAG
jgi:hypothetical protein